MAYQAAVAPSPNTSFRGEPADHRNIPSSHTGRDSWTGQPSGDFRGGGSISGSFRNVAGSVQGEGMQQQYQQHMQQQPHQHQYGDVSYDPNASFVSQRSVQAGPPGYDQNLARDDSRYGLPDHRGSQRSLQQEPPNYRDSQSSLQREARDPRGSQRNIPADDFRGSQRSLQQGFDPRESIRSFQRGPPDHRSSERSMGSQYSQGRFPDQQAVPAADTSFRPDSRQGSIRRGSEDYVQLSSQQQQQQQELQQMYGSQRSLQQQQQQQQQQLEQHGYYNQPPQQLPQPQQYPHVRDFPEAPGGGSRHGGSVRSYQDITRGSRPGSVSRPHQSKAQGQAGNDPRNRRSTGSSVYGMLVEGRTMNGMDIAGLLQQGFVLLTGGRDKQGGPVVTLPSLRSRPDPEPQALMTCLRYLLQIPSEETKRKGVTAVVDTREGSWANLNIIIGCLREAASGYLKQILVVLHERDRRLGQDRPSNAEPRYVTLEHLRHYIDPEQLTFNLGGQMEYHHDSWLKVQLNYERFLQDAQKTIDHLEKQEGEIHQSYGSGSTSRGPDSPGSPLEALRKHRYFQEAIMTVPTEVIRQGQEVLKSLQENGYSGYHDSQGTVPTLDNLEAQKQVKRVLQYLTNRVDKLQDLLEERDRSLNANLQFEEWKRNVKTVVDWVLGPGEKLLASQNDIGDSYEAAEELRRRHEEMEIKCTDTYGQYAELRHTADELQKNEAWPGVDDMRAERDYMDTVCRSFASRLERRRTLLITSVRFHRFAEDFSTSLDELLELLCTDIDAETVEAVEGAMKSLEEKLEACDKLATQSLDEGQSLLDEMSRPIKNAFGKDITPDFERQVNHVNKKLEELQERKLRCDELADVRKLKLQQLLQLRTCERDTDQAIDWINELCDVMVTSHTDMGRSSEEAQGLHEEHRKFEATALGTYDYGKQLLQAALVLRRSLRYEVEPSHERSRRLEEAWRRFSKGTSERANRLTVSAMFLNDSDNLLGSMEEFISSCAKPLAGEASVSETVNQLALPKRQIGKDFDSTVQMGQALLDRLALPIILYEGDERRLSIDDEGASDTVSNRLRKLDRKMAEVDRFWDELQRAESDPNFQTKMQPAFERTPSERRREKTTLLRKPKSRDSAEAEERRRRADPFGIASKRRPRPGSYAGPISHLGQPSPRDRGDRSFDDTDRLNKSYDTATMSPNSTLSLRHNGYLYPDNRERQDQGQGQPGENVGQGYHGRQASLPDLSQREMQYSPMIAQETLNVQASMPNLSYEAQAQPQEVLPSQLDDYQSQADSQYQGGQPDDSVFQDQMDNTQSQSVAPESQEGHHPEESMIIPEDTMSKLEAAPSHADSSFLSREDPASQAESDPLYSNQPVQPRPQRSLLNIDWVSPMTDSHLPIEDQLKQIRVVGGERILSFSGTLLSRVRVQARHQRPGLTEGLEA
ncbi:sec14 domain and spectrin repeat-containing protein 1 [Plakobranchus ocellatus]|uniref:Sec14 domain and spectrin repeat-containing protein 1 n=1 Tax=Plakobranchus ocellatus TaxID=259542 RepID=A0AAV4D3G1_9GAST|nr:sec14 domain and spectrin repeat-containing protein 1 [Plakobranchus ocellatus]